MGTRRFQRLGQLPHASLRAVGCVRELALADLSSAEIVGWVATVSDDATTVSGSMMTSTITDAEELKALLDQAIDMIGDMGEVANAA